jgi:cytochrome c
MTNQLRLPQRVTFVKATFIAVLSLLGVTPAFAAGDAARGRQKFKSTCETCHLAVRDATRNDELTKIAPNLFGVVGRPAGTKTGFRYSAAMKSSGITWTEEVLRAYIKEPQKMIPNVRMSFQGLSNPQDVDDVVTYLATLRYTAPQGTQSAAPSR